MKQPLKTIDPVRPNIGIEMAYRRRLQRLVEAMKASVDYWVKASYRANEPEMAQDSTPAIQLRTAVRRLSRRWQRQFNRLAPEMADYFATTATRRSDAAMREMLKRAGFTVEFTHTPATRDILHATTTANVALIKSIPQKYFTEIEGSVMRAVQMGGDLGALTKELQKTYGVTFRRAALIARDQNRKATTAMTKARQVELGITKAIWQHSRGGNHPRPTHLANSGNEYDVNKGWYDPDVGEWIYPGQLINCRCVSKALIPGFS